MHYLKKKLHFVTKELYFGIEIQILKHKNKILGWIEPFPNNTAVEEETGKFFYAIGNPNRTDNFEMYIVDTIEEGKHALINIFS